MVVALIGCARASQQPVDVTPPISIVPPAAVDPATSVAPLNIFAPGEVTYDITITSITDASNTDSLVQRDSTEVHGVLRARFINEREANTHVELRADSVRTRSSTGTMLQPEGSNYTYEINTLSNSRVQFRRILAPPCTMNDSSILTGTEVLPGFPTSALTLKAWVDTAFHELCRGGMALRITRIAHYYLDSLASDPPTPPLFRFLRNSQIKLEGQGTQWNQPVELIGNGNATDTLLISSQIPRLSTVKGSTYLELTFVSQFRTQKFHQTTLISIQQRK